MSVVLNDILKYVIKTANETDDNKELKNIAVLLGNFKPSFSYHSSLQEIDATLELIHAKRNSTLNKTALAPNNKNLNSLHTFIAHMAKCGVSILITGKRAGTLKPVLEEIDKSIAPNLFTEVSKVSSPYLSVETTEEGFLISNIAFNMGDNFFTVVYMKDETYYRVSRLMDEVKEFIKAKSSAIKQSPRDVLEALDWN